MSEQELKAIDAEVRDIVNAAADFAQHDPNPIRPNFIPTSIAERRAHSSLQSEFLERPCQSKC
jgi:Pyruvate/2-oxoglutarate dehydrogenase complex, dehydrogenase (E1) component, eukaryotic type, alpha subunit